MLLVCSQPAKAEFRYGVTAGPSLNTLKFNQKITPVHQIVGGGAGIVAEMMFPGIGFGLDFGLLYDMTGAKINLGSKPIWAGKYGDEKILIHNIHIPLHLRFKWTRMNGFEDTLAPFVFGGPEFKIQAGHTRCSAFKFSGGEIGLTAGVGVELYKKWQVTGSYTWGMSNVLSTVLLDDYSAHSGQWAVKFTYLF